MCIASLERIKCKSVYHKTTLDIFLKKFYDKVLSGTVDRLHLKKLKMDGSLNPS